MKKSLTLFALIVASAPVAAELSTTSGLSSIPNLPDASQLDENKIGGHYKMEIGGEKKKVVFAGFNEHSHALAFPLEDNPRTRMVFKHAQNYCRNLGDGWDIPFIDEMMAFRPHANQTDVKLLPGKHWTATQIRCDVCKDDLYVSYNPLNGNQGNAYDMDLGYRMYPTCVYRF